MKEEKIIEYMTQTPTYNYNDYNCWDFVRKVYFDLYKYELPEYPVDVVPSEFKGKLEKNIEHIIIDDKNIEEGDIIIFSVFNRQHAGVFIDDNNFIHLGYDGVRVVSKEGLGKNYVIYRICR